MQKPNFAITKTKSKIASAEVHMPSKQNKSNLMERGNTGFERKHLVFVLALVLGNVEVAQLVNITLLV